MNKYLFIRTDRIGDFLLSAILFKAIKRNDNKSHITVIASKNNFNYIKKNQLVDDVILYPDSNFIKKIFFFINNIKKKYYLIGALDGKKRSIYLSLLVKAKFKILCTYKSIYKKIFNSFFDLILLDKDCSSKIEEINKILNLINYSYEQSDLNTLETFKESDFFLKINLIEDNFIQFHLDEKWFHDDYIKSYKKIEPSFDEFFYFINTIVSKTKKNLVITTGIIENFLINEINKKGDKINSRISNINLNGKSILVINNTTIFDLQNIIFKAEILISCHGTPTHIAASFNKKIIDIIDESEIEFFNKWTAHFRNYNQINRTNFKSLSNKITDLL